MGLRKFQLPFFFFYRIVFATARRARSSSSTLICTHWILTSTPLTMQFNLHFGLLRSNLRGTHPSARQKELLSCPSDCTCFSWPLRFSFWFLVLFLFRRLLCLGSAVSPCDVPARFGKKGKKKLGSVVHQLYCPSKTNPGSGGWDLTPTQPWLSPFPPLFSPCVLTRLVLLCSLLRVSCLEFHFRAKQGKTNYSIFDCLNLMSSQLRWTEVYVCTGWLVYALTFYFGCHRFYTM